MKIKLKEYLLPDFWATALFCGDESGMEPDDIKALDDFIDYMIKQHGQCHAVDIKNDSSFCWSHDAVGVLACDCSTYVFDVTKRESQSEPRDILNAAMKRVKGENQ